MSKYVYITSSIRRHIHNTCIIGIIKNNTYKVETTINLIIYKYMQKQTTFDLRTYTYIH